MTDEPTTCPTCLGHGRIVEGEYGPEPFVPIPTEADDRCPTCGSTDPAVREKGCHVRRIDADPWHAPTEADDLPARVDKARTPLEQALWEWAVAFYSEDYSPAGEKLTEIRDLILDALGGTDD